MLRDDADELVRAAARHVAQLLRASERLQLVRRALDSLVGQTSGNLACKSALRGLAPHTLGRLRTPPTPTSSERNNAAVFAAVWGLGRLDDGHVAWKLDLAGMKDASCI